MTCQGLGAAAGDSSGWHPAGQVHGACAPVRQGRRSLETQDSASWRGGRGLAGRGTALWCFQEAWHHAGSARRKSPGAADRYFSVTLPGAASALRAGRRGAHPRRDRRMWSGPSRGATRTPSGHLARRPGANARSAVAGFRAAPGHGAACGVCGKRRSGGLVTCHSLYTNMTPTPHPATHSGGVRMHQQHTCRAPWLPGCPPRTQGASRLRELPLGGQGCPRAADARTPSLGPGRPARADAVALGKLLPDTSVLCPLFETA